MSLGKRDVLLIVAAVVLALAVWIVLVLTVFQ
jgi:hypothetical protein